jgi:hypothetical protein
MDHDMIITSFSKPGGFPMPEKLPFPPPAALAPARVTAAHVQAAVRMTASHPIAQPKMPASIPPPRSVAVPPVARHVESALARTVQGKILSSRTVAATVPRAQPARQHVLQRSATSSSSSSSSGGGGGGGGGIATEVGVGFQDLTSFNAIKAEIESEHGNPDKSLEVISTITMLVWGLAPGGDTVNTWLVALNGEGIRARKWGGSDDLIEIYPSGTHGVGKHDRLWLQVGATQVKVVKVYQSEH